MANDHKLHLPSDFKASTSKKIAVATAVAVLMGAITFSGNPAKGQARCGTAQLREYDPETYRKNCMTLPKATATRFGVLREKQNLRLQRLRRQQLENRRRTLAPRKNTNSSSAQRIRQRKDIQRDRIIINRQKSQ